MKKATIYLLRGGDKKTGFWFLPEYFNYKKRALDCRKHYHKLHNIKVVKFIECGRPDETAIK